MSSGSFFQICYGMIQVYFEGLNKENKHFHRYYLHYEHKRVLVYLQHKVTAVDPVLCFSVPCLYLLKRRLHYWSSLQLSRLN